MDIVPVVLRVWLGVVMLEGVRHIAMPVNKKVDTES